MTVVANQTKDYQTQVWMKKHPSQPYEANVYVGELVFRNSSGSDRAPGTYPGLIKSIVPYSTKSRYKTIVERDPPTYVYSWVNVKVPIRDKRTGGTKLVVRRRRFKKKIRGALHRKTILISAGELKFRTVWARDERFTFEADHVYTSERYRHNSSAGVCVYYGGVWNYEGSTRQLNFLPVNNGIPDPWSSNDDIALLGKLREEIAGSSFNLGIALAEAPKAIQMVADTTTKVFSAYKAVRRGDPFKAVKLLTGKVASPKQRSKLTPTKEAAANNWLELQYGWKPLLTDIYDGMVFVDHQLRNRSTKVYRVRRYAWGIKSGLRQIPFPSNKAFLLVDFSSSSQIVARLSEASVTRLSGLMDPASVAWELLPWSFVADWFIPIGNYMSARELANSLTGVFVTTHRYKFKSKGLKAPAQGALSPLHDGTKCFIEYTKITRTVSTSLSVPKPEFKPLSKVASWQHAANAVALFVGIKR